MTVAETNTTPLDPVVIQTIRTFHLSNMPREFREPNGLTPLVTRPEMVLMYRCDTGQLVGTTSDLNARKHAHRFVKISNHEVPSVEALEAVRVTAEGEVIQ
jgi:hypothetical protein